MKRICLLLSCGLLVAGLYQAHAAAQLRLSDGTVAGTVTITDDGPGDTLNTTPGAIAYIGPVGPNWTANVTVGTTYPNQGTPGNPIMDVGSHNSSADAGTLTIDFTQDGFTAGGAAVLSIGGTTVGTVTYSVYTDPANTPFAETTLVGTTGPLSPGVANGSITADTTGTVGSAAPYSMTIDVVVQHPPGGGETGFDAGVTVTPPNCNGQIGDFVWNDLNGNGCQEAGEPGISGVSVSLYSGCGANKGILLQTTTTDGNGKYLFTGLCEGDYTVSFTTPSGFVHTQSHQGCASGGTPSTDLDSNCECTGADNCDVCVTLPTDNTVDLSIDCGYLGSQPCLTFIKTADTNSAPAGGQVGYTYAITNCGGTTFTNLAIIDDGGTPNFSGDDFTVASGINLAPGQGTSFHQVVTLPVEECVSNAAPGTDAGTLIAQVLPNGDVTVTFRQSRNLNDNVYGTNAPADGWSHHAFSDLTGSDKAEFRFTDGTGKVVLDFFLDYISSTTVSPSAPSGYASLGPNGGDGSMVTGNKSNVLSWTSTLADNLNSGLNGGFPSPYLVNSPTPESAFPNWDYVDGYTVTVSHFAFGANGFGGVTIPFVHNSPAKTGNNQVSPIPCGDCITNTARVVTVLNGNVIGATLATDDAIVCTGGGGTQPPPTCLITEGPLKIGGRTITLPIKNAGSSNIVLTEIDLSWPQGVNGNLTKLTLNGDFWTGPATNSPVTLTSGFVADPNKRTIAKGQTKNLVITFQNNASTTVGDYSGMIDFGSCQLVFPPPPPAAPAGKPKP